MNFVIEMYIPMKRYNKILARYSYFLKLSTAFLKKSQLCLNQS